jgi:hypothetical protein
MKLRKRIKKITQKNRVFSINMDFLDCLTLIFITLRLCKVIMWSWWYVLMPLWLPLVIVGIIVLLLLITCLYDHFNFKNL